MSDFTEKMRLKGQADEDIYFARRERELIEALHRRRPPALRRVISGGQTGVDRGALDAVLAVGPEVGVAAGGWCPRGRLAEDGIIDGRYPLQETPLSDSAQRTEWNVRDADATLLLCRGEPTGGSALTEQVAARLGKPLRRQALRPDSSEAAIAAIVAWLGREGVEVLNVAGPRESEAPGIGAEARTLLAALLRAAGSGCERPATGAAG